VLAFTERVAKNIVGKLRNGLAFPEGTVKKVLASLENCLHLLKELSKSIGKLKIGLAF
jgi:hypothetical protein